MITTTINFDPRHLWIGAYWKTGTQVRCRRDGTVTGERYLEVYLCLLPMVPVRISYTRPMDRERALDEITGPTNRGGTRWRRHPPRTP